MNKNILIATLLLISVFLTKPTTAQQDTIPDKKELSISLEFRPRTEYRNGYRQLRADTSHPAFFTEQRTRLNINYKTNKFKFVTSIQDVRIWGEQDPRGTGGTIQLFEAYVEPVLTKRISARIGRQKIMYDNQRLFAQNDWRQTARSHEAVRFIYKSDKLESELVGAFNQEQGAHERFYETYYSPTFANYKVLGIHYLKYNFSEKLTFTTLNATDGFQDSKNKNSNHFRFTSGGRVEFSQKSLYLTLAGYYQYGSTSAGRKLSAYYYQPEIKYTFPKYLTVRLGAEVFSGDDGKKPSTTSHSFDALYGVAHRFLGSMDFFTRFPQDFNNAGIVDPYLFAIYDVNKKFTIRSDFHLFYSQNNFVRKGEVVNKYLGFENDLLLIYKANDFTEIQLGYSYALLEKSMEYIKKGGNSKNWHDWAYLMLTFKPELFNWKK